MSDTPTDTSAQDAEETSPSPEQASTQPSAPRIPAGGVKYQPPERVESSTPLTKAIAAFLFVATIVCAGYAFFYFDDPLAPVHGVVVVIGGLFISARLAGFIGGGGS